MSRKTRRRYTTEFKAEAVKLVLETRLSCAQAARDPGIPRVCRAVGLIVPEKLMVVG